MLQGLVAAKCSIVGKSRIWWVYTVIILLLLAIYTFFYVLRMLTVQIIFVGTTTVLTNLALLAKFAITSTCLKLLPSSCSVSLHTSLTLLASPGLSPLLLHLRLSPSEYPQCTQLSGEHPTISTFHVWQHGYLDCDSPG